LVNIDIIKIYNQWLKVQVKVSNVKLKLKH